MVGRSAGELPLYAEELESGCGIDQQKSGLVSAAKVVPAVKRSQIGGFFNHLPIVRLIKEYLTLFLVLCPVHTYRTDVHNN